MQKQPPSFEKWLCVRGCADQPRPGRLSVAVPTSDHGRRRVESPHGRRGVGAAPSTQTIPLHGLGLEVPLTFDGDSHHRVTVATAPADTGVEAEEGPTTVVDHPRTAGGDLRAVRPLEGVCVNFPVQEDGNLDTLTRVHLGHLAGSAAPTEDGDQNRQNNTDKRLDFHVQNSLSATYISTFYIQCQA